MPSYSGGGQRSVLFLLYLSYNPKTCLKQTVFLFSALFFSVSSFSQLQSYILHINPVFKITILMTHPKKPCNCSKWSAPENPIQTPGKTEQWHRQREMLALPAAVPQHSPVTLQQLMFSSRRESLLLCSSQRAVLPARFCTEKYKEHGHTSLAC